MVDYSKWDNLDVSSDDEQGPVRVTKFNKGTTVTCGSSGWSAEGETWKKKKRTKEATEAAEATKTAETTGAPVSRPSAPFESCCRGGHDSNHCWDQTKTDISIRLALPVGIRARDLTVRFLDDNSQPPGQYGVVKRVVVAKSESTLYDLQFPFDVESNPDSLFWEVKDAQWSGKPQGPALCLDVKKKVHDGMAVWWDKPFTTFPAVDMSLVLDEKQQAKQAELRAAWDEAHRIFKEKVKEQQPMEI